MRRGEIREEKVGSEKAEVYYNSRLTFVFQQNGRRNGLYWLFGRQGSDVKIWDGVRRLEQRRIGCYCKKLEEEKKWPTMNLYNVQSEPCFANLESFFSCRKPLLSKVNDDQNCTSTTSWCFWVRSSNWHCAIATMQPTVESGPHHER